MRQRRIFMALVFVTVLTASAWAGTAWADSRGKLSVDLLLDWETVVSPQISPDGSQIVYTRRWADKVNDKYESDVWIINSDGSKNRFLVKGSSPAWSPDGKRILYVANGQPSGSQIFVRWMDTGEETQLTRLERTPTNIEWSPDGRRIAFNMSVPSKPEFTVKMPARPAGAKWIDSPRVIDRLDYRSDGVGYRPEGFAHIFVIPDTGGTPRQLTDGDYNHGAPEWTPDSQKIIFSGVRKPDAEYLRGGSEIYSLSVSDGVIAQLTDRNGPDANPAVSPDGRFIAYTGFDQTDDTYTVSKLYVMDIDGKNKRLLTEGFDRSPQGLIWAADSSGLHFTTEDRGTDNLYFEPLKGGNPQAVTQGVQQLTVTSIAKNGIATGVLQSPTQPGDVVAFDIKHPTPKKLTGVNDDLLEGRALGAVEEIWYDSVGGMRAQGWVVKPPDFNPSRKYPLMLYIHGGPHSMYGVGFNFEFQNHAAEGYVVLYTNPRGSTGYGQQFGNAIKFNYPGQDYDDLMNGVDAVIKKGYIDERNLFVCGGSGGGVLTSWIVGHTNRFAAAVVMKPVINWYSFVGTTDGSSWYYNFKRLPWEDSEEHMRRSPITYVGNVKTPTMLMTGELDLRTPMEQTEQYYRALKLRKVDTVMVRIQDEYHGFNATPRHPSNRLNQILYLRGWFEKYKKKDAA
ncbi:MAG TPA: S9 family peptidase [Blastocatellia bacterium]|nr:S9 family peptidase [Blastocatellia bacterium]